LETPKKSIEKSYKPKPYIFKKSRKELKHYFLNYAKTFKSLKNKNFGQITTLTLLQYINKFTFDRPMNNIENQIIQS